MRLLIITPEYNVPGETGIVTELFRSGLQRLHVRKQQFTVEDMTHYIDAIPNEYHSRMVIHNHFELADELGIGGIHLNTTARNDKEAWGNISHIIPSAISTSFHSWEEIRENKFHYGYVFISPVFDSISKEGYKAGIDLAGAAAMQSELKNGNEYCPPIVGLGGVGVTQLPILREHGFDGAAMLGAIWQAGSPVAIFHEAMKAAS